MSSARIIVLIAVLCLALAPASAVGAVEEPPEEPTENLLAPFTCGTEWQGTTYSGHGTNNWTLDLNRTDLVWPDPLHDLGQPILAQGDGTVVHVAQTGWNSGAGTYLEVDYGDVTAVYVHLVENSITVEVGDVVDTGQLLGEVGNTGNIISSTAEKLAHLHLAYWDSSGMEDARAYQLSNQIPVVIDGVELIATPGNPSPAFVSTNCVDGDRYPFGDVSLTSFAREDIALLFELAITTGTGAGRYSPDQDVTREQMAAFLARLWRLVDAGETELPEELPMPFGDVADTSFALDDVALLAHFGITQGTGEGEYSPDDAVTREQMAAFLGRLWRLLDGGGTELPEELPMPFGDVAGASFAHGDIALLAHLEITTGVGEGVYGPDQPVDREQMAAFLARLYRLFAADA